MCVLHGGVVPGLVRGHMRADPHVVQQCHGRSLVHAGGDGGVAPTPGCSGTELPEPHRDWRGHAFWPPASVLEAIPALYATEHQRPTEKVVHLHYFVGPCDWWVVEVDSIERPQLAFGFVCLGDPASAEWGYIDLHELAEVWRPLAFEEEAPSVVVRSLPLIIERDLHWRPRPAGEVIPYLNMHPFFES